MSNLMPTLLALDFDGVLCDGLIEYFQTAWQAYCRVWKPDSTTPPPGSADRFYRLRPVVETGWEMPVLVHALIQGIDEEDILDHWPTIASELANAANLDRKQLAAAVDGYRDEWIARDLDHWLAQHRFYPGVVEQLQRCLASETSVAIVTTKEGRFVRKLLQQSGVSLEKLEIFGKEVKRPKYETLRLLIAQLPEKTQESDPSVWFVEDRLKALQQVEAQPDLQAVHLFLADWGYNIERDRQQAQESNRIHLLDLQTFGRSFESWRTSKA